MIAGGYSSGDTGEAQQIADSVRAEVERNLGHPAEMYTVLDCKTQVVAGVSYKMKIQVAETECVHVRVLQPLAHTGQAPMLKKFTGGKTLADPLD